MSDDGFIRQGRQGGSVMIRKAPWDKGPIRTDKTTPYFYHGEEPFFWLGDTAWLLFHNLKREEISLYLENRAEKGFNVIQAVAVHKMPAMNAYGREAFENGDMTKPIAGGADGYWETLDYAVEKARTLGLYIGLLPHWGGVVKGGHINIGQVEDYIRFLAGRYKDCSNIIWITGGDNKGDKFYEYWRRMGLTLKEVTPEKLVTFHPFGRTTSIDYFPQEEWMDFHMFQSGHRRYDQQQLRQWDDTASGSYYYGEDSFRYVERVRERKPFMPVLDGEPSYEHIPQGLHDPSEPFWQDYDVRRYAYWSVLAGAAGFTYGHSSIMQFFKGEGKGAYGATIPWMDALHSPGSDNMAQLARLMTMVNFAEGKEASELLVEKNAGFLNTPYDRIGAFAGKDFALFYTYTGRTVMLRTRTLGGKGVRAWWFDPVSGVFSYAGIREKEQLCFTVPKGTYTHTDWVLLLRPAEERI